MDGMFERIALIFKLFMVPIVLVVGKLLYVMYIAPSEISAEEISTRKDKIEAMRGDILDRKGRALATSIPFYEIRIDFKVPHDTIIRNEIGALGRNLASFFRDKSSDTYIKELKAARKEGKRYYKLGNRNVDYSELQEIKKFPILKYGANRGGLIVLPTYERRNPYGRLAMRTIGYINKAGQGSGIEMSCDYYLKGTDGEQTVQRMLGGTWIPVNGTERIEPKDGYDIQTTIDIDIQEMAEKALREQISSSDLIEGATAIVMEVETGAIRAIANMKRTTKGNFDESFNYAIGYSTEPGSVFKLVTLVALLEDEHITLDTQVDARGGRFEYGTYTLSDTHDIGIASVKEAFAESSNVAFAKLALKHYGENPYSYTDRVQSMKVGERFNLDIWGESRAVIHSPSDSIWSKTTLTSMAIGYGAQVTPLHTLTFYNAIANDGKMVKPYFIDNYQKDGEIVKKFKPQEISGAICSKSTAAKAREALIEVVESGTGKKCKNSNYKVGGKTGTARVAFGNKGYKHNGKMKYQGSFCGIFPADNPKYSVMVVVYSNPSHTTLYGAQWALPVFKKIADYIYTISPEWKESLDGSGRKEKGVPSMSTGKTGMHQQIISELGIKEAEGVKRMSPSGWVRFKKDSTKLSAQKYPMVEDSLINVVDMGLRDALYLLENMGYRVKFKGQGRVVKQTPAAGSSVAPKTVINLELSDYGAK